MSHPPSTGPRAHPTGRRSRSAERDSSRTTVLTIVSVIAAGLSFVYSMLTGAVALDVCRHGCDLPVNVAIMGVAWGGIVVAGLVRGIGAKRARARHQPTSPWALLALVIIVVTCATSVIIVNAVAGLI